MSRSHFVEMCEYGHSHSQCRCPAKDKQVRPVACDDLSHATEPRPDGLGEHLISDN